MLERELLSYVSIHDVDLDESLTCEVSYLRSTNQEMTRMLFNKEVAVGIELVLYCIVEMWFSFENSSPLV